MELDAIAVAFGLVIVAELGDKSQLAAMTFASRYGFWRVLVAISIATAVIQALSVGAGALVATAIPEDLIGFVAGALFLTFAVVTLVARGSDDGARDSDRKPHFVIAAIAVAYFISELGDKTMLVTATLATTQPWLSVWIGSTIGMITANTVAIGIGAYVGRRLPMRTMRYIAAGLFALTGLWLIIDNLMS